MANKSSDFYRLEKCLGKGCVDVYEFHTVINGNMYIAHHEEYNGSFARRYRDRVIKEKNEGNKRYVKLLNEGYKFAGKYEMDICGRKTKKP